MNPPIRSTYPPTHVRKEFIHLFQTPMSSFLAYLPIKVWIDIVYYSNLYASQIISEKGERNDNNDLITKEWKAISLQELMTFMGILLGMASTHARVQISRRLEISRISVLPFQRNQTSAQLL